MLNSFIKTKKNFYYIFLFLYNFQFISASSICDNKSPFYPLYLNTSYTQDYSNSNISIISDCSINEYWRVKTGKEANFHIHKILEDEKFNRRILKFGYNFTKNSKSKFSEKYLIKLKSNIVEGAGHVSFGSQNFENAKNNEIYQFYFEPKLDINYMTYITYYCEPDNIFFKTKIDITMIDTESNEEEIFPIELLKICKHTEQLNDDSIDICHAIIIMIAVGIIIFSNSPSFESKLELTILKKFPEVWKSENLSLINLLLVILLYILYIQNILNYFLYVTTIIVSIFSLAMVFEALLKNTPIKKNLNNRSLELDFIGSLSMYLIFCIFISSILFIIYELTHNILINDIISISISLESIRIFKFSSFKFILILCFLIWCYQIFYMIINSSDLILHYYNGILINQFDISFPILILCTQITPYTSLYTEYVCLSIGEVILPGIYINYLYRFDKKIHLYSNFYYFLGIGVFLFCLFIKILLYCYAYLKMPAFAFFFPCLTIAVFYFALEQQRLADLLSGFKDNPYRENEIGSKTLDSFAQSYMRASNISSFE